jgi:hypothetical protein
VRAGLVKDENGMGAGRDRGADLKEVRLHRFGVGERHDEGRALAEPRADRAEERGRERHRFERAAERPLRSLVVRRSGGACRGEPIAG